MIQLSFSQASLIIFCTYKTLFAQGDINKSTLLSTQPPASSQTSPAQSQTTTPATAKRKVQNKEPSQTEEEPAGYVTPDREVS